MSAIRLTAGTCGCPPTETPPGDYVNPFRFDDAGCLWLANTFFGFKYFGAARHDIGSTQIIGSGGVPVSTDPDIVAGTGVTAGTYTSYVINNNTGSDLGILLGPDMYVDMSTKSVNLVKFILSSRWNGAHHSQVSASSVNHDGVESFIRTQFTASANPHDLGVEVSAVPLLTVADGASATVSAKLFVQYIVGSPTGTEVIVNAASAVRVYGYIL